MGQNADTSPAAMQKLRTQIQKTTHPMQTQAEAVVIITEDDYLMAGEFVVRGKALVKDIIEKTKPVVDAAHRVHKEATTLRNDLAAVPATAWRMVEQKMIKWRQEQDAIRRKAEAEAREKQRLIDEQAQLDRALELDKQGHKEAAEAVISAPPTPTAVVAHAPIPKVKGLRVVANWQARVVDEAKIPRQYMIPDMGAISKHAKTWKSKTNIPGVEVWDANAATK